MKRPRPSSEDVEAAKKDAIEDALIGNTPRLLGKKLRPVTLLSIALLMKTNNGLVQGKPLDGTVDLLLDCLKFIVIQSRPLSEVYKLLRDPDRFELEAWREGENLSPADAESLVFTAAELLRVASSTKVSPVATVTAGEVSDADLSEALADGEEDGEKK